MRRSSGDLLLAVRSRIGYFWIPAAMRTLTFAVAALALVLTGCSGGPSWFRGTWELDAKATVDAALKAEGKPQPVRNPDGSSKSTEQALGNLLDTLARGIGEALAPALLASEYDKATVTITGSDITIMKNGNGRSLTYKVLDSTSDSITIKTSDDKIATWYRRDAMIATKPGSDIKVDLMFKRLK